MTQYPRDYVKMISQMTPDTKDSRTGKIFRAGQTLVPPIWGNLFLMGKIRLYYLPIEAKYVSTRRNRKSL